LKAISGCSVNSVSYCYQQQAKSLTGQFAHAKSQHANESDSPAGKGADSKIKSLAMMFNSPAHTHTTTTTTTI